MRDNLFTIRVADCHAVHAELRARGGTFLTPPVRHGDETRCFLRDPDGHLFELERIPPGLTPPQGVQSGIPPSARGIDGVRISTRPVPSGLTT